MPLRNLYREKYFFGVNFIFYFLFFETKGRRYPLKFQGRFGEYWARNMYLLTCGPMMKMK
jgi:hypothetical protein